MNLCGASRNLDSETNMPVAVGTIHQVLVIQIDDETLTEMDTPTERLKYFYIPCRATSIVPIISFRISCRHFHFLGDSRCNLVDVEVLDPGVCVG